MSIQDEIDAQRALMHYLTEWEVDEAALKARKFINELTARGWQMDPNKESRPMPPRAGEACPHHPGGRRDACIGCAADTRVGDKPGRRMSKSERYAERAEELRAARARAVAGLCLHGVPPENCVEHRAEPTSKAEPTDSPEDES